MKTTIEVDLKPFMIPQFVVENRPKVVEQSDPDGALNFRLGDLDSETLDRLCREFTTGVFNKADKARMPEPEPGRPHHTH